MPKPKTLKPYSQSQKIRFALFDLWSAKIGGKPFEVFYFEETEKIIESIRQKTNE